MNDSAVLGPWIRRFLLEHLVGERNLARNTQRSYRDTFRLLLPFMAKRGPRSIEALLVEDLSPERLRTFLRSVETERACTVATRNQRLAAIHAFARFVAIESPEHIAWAGEVRAVAFKKTARPAVEYLDKREMTTLLAVPDLRTTQGRRDHVLLLFLYNTGARADEAAHVTVGDLRLASTPGRDPASVIIHGKGAKVRTCPLWPSTSEELSGFVEGRPTSARVFLNRRGQPMTRFGVYALVKRMTARAGRLMPSLRGKRVSPHTIRHSTAMHLLRASVDINTIRAWLGHVSLTTTNIYAEADLEMKAKALSSCEIESGGSTRRWREDPSTMEFLATL